MTSRHATALLATSATLLLATAIAWWAVAAGSASADLVGAEATTTSTTVTTSTTAPPTTAAPTTTAPPEPPASDPVRVRIPQLAVDSPVVPVGLEQDGSMEVPGATDAGWYLHGVQPGSAVGSAVIAAHVDFGGRRGVFFDLRDLSVGAEVLVEDDRGRQHAFTVTERYQVAKDALAIPELFRDTGAPALTLITCGGAFDRGARSYADNIVVRAVPA